MLPESIAFKELASKLDKQYREANLVFVAEGWCDDMYNIQLRSEELVNLIGLGKKFPNLKLSNEDLF